MLNEIWIRICSDVTCDRETDVLTAHFIEIAYDEGGRRLRSREAGSEPVDVTREVGVRR